LGLGGDVEYAWGAADADRDGDRFEQADADETDRFDCVMAATAGPKPIGSRFEPRRYSGMFNKARRDRLVFGDRNSGAYLHKFVWTRFRVVGP
jgi:hypothetical protein